MSKIKLPAKMKNFNWKRFCARWRNIVIAFIVPIVGAIGSCKISNLDEKLKSIEVFEKKWACSDKLNSARETSIKFANDHVLSSYNCVYKLDKKKYCSQTISQLREWKEIQKQKLQSLMTIAGCSNNAKQVIGSLISAIDAKPAFLPNGNIDEQLQAVESMDQKYVLFSSLDLTTECCKLE